MIQHDPESRLLLTRERADLLARGWVSARLPVAVEMRGDGFVRRFRHAARRGNRELAAELRLPDEGRVNSGRARWNGAG